jgi:hypothetical protein
MTNKVKTKLFSSDDPALASKIADFNTLLEGYKAGHYLITRDWAVLGSPAAATAATTHVNNSNYRNAIALASNDPASYPWIGPGAFSIPNMITTTAGIEADLLRIENKTVSIAMEILAPQGLTGPWVEAMVRALVIQLGQDTEEFRAFHQDLTDAGLTAATHLYSVSPQNVAMAPMGTQSVKLAGIAPRRKKVTDTVFV